MSELRQRLRAWLADLRRLRAADVLRLALRWARAHPGETAVAVLALVRLFGTTVDSGWRGLVFRLGHARRQLGPGFHMLWPWIERVKKVRDRSVTLDAPQQRATSADGLVYLLDANLVFRVSDPRRALVVIDDFLRGAHLVLGLTLREVVGGLPARELADWAELDRRLAATLAPKLARWGLTLERAGVTSIAPTRATLRLSQLQARVRERRLMADQLVAAGLAPRTALALLGSGGTRRG